MLLFESFGDLTIDLCKYLECLGALLGENLLLKTLHLFLDLITIPLLILLLVINQFSFDAGHLILDVVLDAISFLSDRVVHLQSCVGDDFVTNLLQGLVNGLLHNKHELVIKLVLKVFKTRLELCLRDLLQALSLVLLVVQVDLLLETNQYILVAIDFLFKLLLASLSLLDLQVQRFDIPLDLFDALDDFLFKDLLTVFDVLNGCCTSCSAYSSLAALASMVRRTCAQLSLAFEVESLALHLSLCQGAKIRRTCRVRRP